jgi:tetratricopeptide (TPR) repeat protein
VDELYERHGWYREVIDQVQQDATLGPAVRTLALQIAQSRKWGDTEKLANEAWETIKLPNKGIEAYRVALEKAGKADALKPNDPPILTTLGAGQYRVGSYEEALKTLAVAQQILSEAGEQPDPWNLAFKVMSLHKIGRAEQAKAALEQLRELCKDEQFAEDLEVQGLLAEAERLLSGEKQ